MLFDMIDGFVAHWGTWLLLTLCAGRKPLVHIGIVIFWTPRKIAFWGYFSTRTDGSCGLRKMIGVMLVAADPYSHVVRGGSKLHPVGPSAASCQHTVLNVCKATVT